jgi:hypothetical protein
MRPSRWSSNEAVAVDALTGPEMRRQRPAFDLLRAIVFLAVFAIACEKPAAAADATAATNASTPTVPGDDIFGITSPTDLGNAGDRGFANENDGRIGKRSGLYGALNAKYEFSYTISPDWWIAASPFLAYDRTHGVPGLPNVDRLNLDGFSVEFAHRVIARSSSNPFAVTITIEPRWGRIDPVTGWGSTSWSATPKLFVDAAIVPDKLFWAANMQVTSQTAQDPLARDRWLASSQLLLSTAMTAQISKSLFIGAEARSFTVFDRAWVAHPVGRAFYLGPTLLWKINDNVAVNVTVQPQLFGRAAANRSATLDLDDFERAQFRLKLAATF